MSRDRFRIVSVKELVKDLVRYFPSQIVPALVGFVSIPLLTKLFPPSDYGDYRLVLAAVALLSPMAGWLTTAIVRFYPEYDLKGRLGGFYSTISRLWLLSIMVFAGLWGGTLLFARGAMRHELAQMLGIGLALLIVNSTFGNTGSLVRSQRQVIWFSFVSVARSLLNLGLGVSFILLLGWGISGYLLGMAVAGALAVPLFWWRSTRGVSFSLRDRVDWTLARSMFRYSYPLLLASSASWILRLSDRFILGAFRGAAEVGIYTASYGLADTSIGMILTLFQMPFIVLANRLFEQRGDAEAADFLTQSARLYLLVTIPAVVGVSILSRPLVEVLTGPEYIEGYRIVPFVSAASLLAGMGFWFRIPFMFRKRTEFTLLAIGGGAVVNVGLNLWLIPRFGYFAAGVTTLLGFLTLDILAYLLSRKFFTWRLPLVTVVKTLAASLIMAAVVGGFVRVSPLSISLTLVVSVVIGIVVVGVALVAMREITRAEMGHFRELFRSFSSGSQSD